ncbi:MAG TPA: DUF805 domain-containing protein [Rhizomicrobium sp.]
MFGFQGKMERAPYAAGSLGIFLAQYVLVIAIFASYAQPLITDWRFYVMPLRSLVELRNIPLAALTAALGLTLLVSWILASLAFRRATDANVSGWIAAIVVAPIFQIAAILLLCVLPSRSESDAGAADVKPSGDWPVAVQGVLAGAALTLFAVAVGALIFGTYGFGMFVVSPFVIGATTAFLANRKGDIGRKRTFQAVVAGLALGGVGLVVGALEGIVCIVLAAPLALGAAAIGAALGRAAALSGKRSNRDSLMGLVLLPMVFGSEYMLPANTFFSTTESIDIAAAPHDVWRSIVDMGAITSPVSLPFKLGVAYPVRGDIIGTGVGAIRRGTFSTGIALERVTEWSMDRKLAFVVISDPPAMHELSPYQHVNAPHVKGYFRTTYTSFAILPLGNGRCRVIEKTRHELRLDPILYWMPFARWIIHDNNMRVLSHIQHQAEALHIASL